MRDAITIDARWLHTGLGTYTYNLIAGLGRVKESWSLRAIVNAASAERLTQFCDAVCVLRTPIYTLREQIEIPWAARGSDLLHVPHYNAPVLFRGKLVVTIHDLIHLMDAKEHNRLAVRAYAGVMLRAVARRADHIITVSEFSRARIVELLGVDPARITVIPNGVAARFSPAGEEDDSAGSGARPDAAPYFLYVGNLKPHKNLERFLTAVASFRQRTKLNWTFLIVGPGSESEVKNLRSHASRLGIEQLLVFKSAVSDDELLNLYRRAQFTVMPSLLEGFGFPVLEAMACGTPVVCSRAASLPEVGGDAAQYFDPLDVDSISQALEIVATCPETRAGLRRKGLERASQFSWERSVQRHVELFERVMRN
jgi:glycosyltransferase involved in cell wall biosynthesis